VYIAKIVRLTFLALPAHIVISWCTLGTQQVSALNCRPLQYYSLDGTERIFNLHSYYYEKARMSQWLFGLPLLVVDQNSLVQFDLLN